MVDNEKVNKLKQAIGLDFNHTHAPINQPMHPPMQAPAPQQQNPTPQQQPPQPKPAPSPANTFQPALNSAPSQAIPEPVSHPAGPSILSQPEPHPIQEPHPVSHIEQHITQKPVQAPPIEAQKKENTSLFVKIDRHMEITDEIIGTRTEMKKMLETISLLSKAEKLKAEAVEKIEKRLNVFDEKLNLIDNNLVAPKEFASQSIIPITGEDTELEGLKTEINRLKSELNTL